MTAQRGNRDVADGSIPLVDLRLCVTLEILCFMYVSCFATAARVFYDDP